jgi:hypothetical protein
VRKKVLVVTTREYASGGEMKISVSAKGGGGTTTGRAEGAHSYGERSENYCSFLIEIMS